MRTLVPVVIACLLWAVWFSCASAQEADRTLPGWLVTSEALESKIAEAEAATDITDEAKTQLIELYRKALSNVQTARDNAASAARFQRSAEGAPAQIQAIRAALAPDAAPADPRDGLDADADTPLPELEQRLQKEQADLAATDARRVDIESRLAIFEQRPTAISQRLAETTQQREEASAQLQMPAADDTSPLFAQAEKWALETRYVALSTETTMLEQELSTLPLRTQLLEAKLDKEGASSDLIGERIELLSQLADRKRRQAAEQATTEAEQTQREIAGMHPVLVELSAQNAALSRDVNEMTKRLQAQDLVRQNLDELMEQIDADYKDARETLESGEVNDTLGRILSQQLKTLPDPRGFAQKAEVRQAEIADLNVHRLEYRAEARRLADTDTAIERLTREQQGDASVSPEPATWTEPQKAKLLELVQQRQEQLNNALETNRLYLGKLRELDRAEQALLATAAEYDAYLDEHLPWLRNAKPIRLEDIRALPGELSARLMAADLPGLPHLMYRQLSGSPAFWLAVIGTVALLWRRRAMIAAIQSIAPRVGKPTTDRMGHSGRVLALTLLVAAPLPVLLMAVGWSLQTADGATVLSLAISEALMWLALYLAILLGLRAICLPQGLAAAHFRWPERNLKLLRTQISLLIWPLACAVLTVDLAINLYPADNGGTLAKLGLVLGFVPLSWFLHRVFRPQHGVLTQLRAGGEYPVLARTYWLWYPLVVGSPLALVGLALSGYVFTATAYADMYLFTLWFMLSLLLGNALALRWLQVTRRRLAFDAAMERRRAEQEEAEEQDVAGEMADLHFEAPEIDITALSDETRGLIRILMITTAIVGLYLIWSSALPALRTFDDIVLWYGTVTVDGSEQRLPITLASLGLALLYGVGTWVLADRLPALLEILLLQRFQTTAAGRYTVTTLTTYAVIAVGLLLVLSTLGARWSQVQWLVAALSVGIGFGLQEIVANFISGLIILFERPIRVGDAVTVGDTDGVVTKIKIRATTIRNWDGKELLVPNKEFITGRLLNWSLSDQTTRLVLAIGIAYGAPVRQAMELLAEAARENPNVLDEPSPSVIFETFGDNALGLLLRCFVGSIDQRVSTISALNEAINDKFNAAGISIAFPQRDLHLDTIKPLRVQIEHMAAAND
ncbi:mechanosensitive ion channel [Thiorhodococcus mannitoliphagus]|uniref:Mechanosensitive ion channel n=1 Tax=Thiorhodococcus mannitoliphagus TaxID=329406 RepID=A0A6P1DX93_9GAMM|nr:mechanosensitive ion channel domain-containing protein [Thiorhodococcus mannitoliphagus]NEX22309.1 mechanosensitive ion channel [Thiorhodococcus mannitoliphagus]